ncbi:MAG: NAD-dependent epimerase/dehydratase family protein [Chitinophagales bacterium]|nr:NAD-dependent epimerase/dehydratase family protein [Chitinophagales bacterium]MDW8417962.1 NAD-dependent epimerase/dehydratase family protein [Chitinophagales bacterium]
MTMRILLTGIKGFVGFHLARRLADNYDVWGIDLAYPEGTIHHLRHKHLPERVQYRDVDIRDHASLGKFIAQTHPQVVIHLAACTGIAASEHHRDLYFDTNVTGFANLLQHCHAKGVQCVLYASSSSVYSPMDEICREERAAPQPLSFYGQTKLYGEKLARNYAEQFGMRSIGLRLFTVYGSWVRTDMAAWKFMRALERGEPCTLYNQGEVYRDFTHVSDIVNAITRIIEVQLWEHLSVPHEIYNIGHGSPVSVKEYLIQIAGQLGREPDVRYAPLPVNELPRTHADTSRLRHAISYTPACPVHEGVREMVEWYKIYGKMLPV